MSQSSQQMKLSSSLMVMVKSFGLSVVDKKVATDRYISIDQEGYNYCQFSNYLDFIRCLHNSNYNQASSNCSIKEFEKA